MNPSAPQPGVPEQAPAPAPAIEVPVIPVAQPTMPAAQPVTPAPAPAQPSAPAVPATPPVADPAATPTVAPALAADVDVIEKEWVDAAEAIVARTAGDPHAEEEEVEKLQVDYLKKRYGKEVKPAGEQ